MKTMLKLLALVATVVTGAFLQAATPPTGSQAYYGLFVGVNEYRSANYLLGCDWDAMRMMDSYTRGGFCDVANAELLANLDATKDAVRAKFNALAGKAKSGDTVLFYQSSHGGDYDDDKGSYLCLTDDDWYDTEFAEDLAKFADGVRVIVVLDACFSGGMFKSANGVASASKKDKWDFAARVQRRLESRRSAAKATGTKGVASVAWITAADWNETARMDDRGSEFTHAILGGWEDGSADTDLDGYVSFGELSEYAKGEVVNSSVQSDNDALLDETLAGKGYDVGTFRLLLANDTLYGFLGKCPASVSVPLGTVAIAASAFDADYNDVSELQSVTIPASMTAIAEYAFYGCESLETVTFEGDMLDISFADTLTSTFYGTPWLNVVYPPPANDDFENAITLAGVMSGDLVSTNVNASVEGGEPLVSDWDATSTMWWKWTAPESGPVQFNTFGSDFDTIMGVYTGDTLGNLVLVADNDDAKGVDGYLSQVAFNATAGTTYYIDVGGYDGAEGCVSLAWGPYDVEFSLVVEDGVLTGFTGICPTSVTIPDNVTSIGKNAFFNCNLLESVTFSEGLLSIDEKAFAWCVSLTDVALPSSLEFVGDFAFSGCASLEVVSYGGQEMSVSSEELWEIMDVERVFEQTPWLGFSLNVEDGWVVGYFGEILDGEMVDLEIPDGVDGIEDGAFEGLAGLRSLYVPASVTYIGENAFADCPDLEEVVFLADDSVTESCLEIGEGAFCGCESLASVSFEDRPFDPDNDVWNEIYIFGSAFEGCEALTDLYLGEGVVEIGEYAFCGIAIESLDIPASVMRIGEYAFAGCENLLDVYYAGCDVYGEDYFYELDMEDEDLVFEGTPYGNRFRIIWDEDCVYGYKGELPEGEMLDLEVPDGITSVEDGAFEGLAGLRSLYVPASVTYIGENAFADCPDLEEVVFLADDSVTESCLEIGEGAFCGCESLASVSFEDRPFDPDNDVWNEIYIFGSAFEGCEALTDLYLGEGVVEIGEYAFCGIAIESLDIPASTTYIGDGAFADCENLEEVTFAGHSLDFCEDSEIDMDVESAFEGTPWLEGYLTPPLPANDDFAHAEVIEGMDGEVYGWTIGASVEDGESIGRFDYDEEDDCFTSTVWYKWTAPESGTVSFGVADADFDSMIGVYKGSSVKALTKVALNDDADAEGFRSFTAFDAVAGTTYYIAVGGYSEGDEGSFSLVWAPYEWNVTFDIDAAGVLRGVDFGLAVPSVLTIPEGVKAIAEEAFGEYYGFTTVNLPSTLKSIGAYAFAWCHDLATVNGLTDAIEVGKQAFWETAFEATRPFGLDVFGNSLVGFHGPCARSVEIPDGVTNVAECAFCYWDYCKEGEAYDKDADEWHYFDICSLTNLVSLSIPASVVSVGEWAFENCANLSTVSVGNPEIKIDGSALSGCTALTAIGVEKVGHSLVGWDLFREKNPARYAGSHWDEELGRWIPEYEEYEPDAVPTGTVMRVESIESLVYGMTTGALQTNQTWDVQAGGWVDVVVLATNHLAGVWATPAWKVNQYTLEFDSAGGSDVAPITRDYGTSVKTPAAPQRKGYTFTGWAPEVPATMPAEDVVLTAQWTPNRYTVTFDANGGKGSMAVQSFVYDAEQLLSECAFERSAHEFLGWSLAADSDEIAFFDGENVLNLTAEAGGNVNLYAVWERTTLWAPVGDGTGAADGSGGDGGSAGDNMFSGVAEAYDGYVQDPDTGLIVGTIQVKVGKSKLDRKTQKEVAKVSATVQLVSEKKMQVKGVLDMATDRFEATDKSGRELILFIGANSLSGTYGKYLVDGAQDKFATKNAGAKEIGAAALARCQGVWTVAWPAADGSGWNGMSLTVAAKGKVKVAGMMANGTKISASSKLLVGDDDVCVIPVVVAKRVQLAFTVWLSPDGVEVVGLDGAVPSSRRVGALAGGAAMGFDAAAFCSMIGDSTFANCLPVGLSVAQNGTKWVVADGAKAGKVQLTGDGAVDEAKAGVNPSALKISFTAKLGTFKGSFKAYKLVKGKPKATTVTVSGILVDGVGYGTAFVKKVGGVPLTIK